MASRLPKRWEIDKRLLPAEAPYPAPSLGMGQLPPAVRGLAGVAKTGPLKLLSRRLEAYNEGVDLVIAELEDRPQELARLLREAERRRDGAPGIDPIGAAALDTALGGIVFGDELPRLAEEGEDPASRVGELLENAAERQGEGVSVSLLADWLRYDAARVEPEGPAAAAERLDRRQSTVVKAGRGAASPGAATRRVGVGREHAVGQPAGQGTAARGG